jgi:hypothetical protein
MSKYREMLWPLAAAALVAVTAAVKDGWQPTQDGLAIAVAVFGAVVVWLTANLDVPYWNQAKAIAMAGAAGFAALQSVITDGITAQEWITVGIMVGAALGIWKTPSYVHPEQPAAVEPV